MTLLVTVYTNTHRPIGELSGPRQLCQAVDNISKLRAWNCNSSFARNLADRSNREDREGLQHRLIQPLIDASSILKVTIPLTHAREEEETPAALLRRR